MNRSERRKLAKLSNKNTSSTSLNEQQLSELARNNLINGHLDKALKNYKMLLEMMPDNPSILHFAGITRYKLGHYTEAIQLFDKAISYAPAYAEAYNSKGIVLLQQREYQKSSECFENSIKLKPNYDNAYFNLGNALKELNQLDDAIYNYEKSLIYNNHNIEAAYKLAALNISKNDIKSALEYCDYSLQINPYCQNALAYKAIASLCDNNLQQWKDLYDLDGMIKQFQIDTPNRFTSTEEFNSVLAHDILNHKSLIWDSLDRVTNGGAVTSDLLINPTKAIKQLEKSIKHIVNDFITTLPTKDNHPFYSLKPKKYTLTLIGSILIKNGVHPPHVHENSWLSGVYYIKMPNAVANDDPNHLGWLEFGRPDLTLPDDSLLKVTTKYPNPGSLLIFPSYFFHGTIPFQSDEKRIGIAFDLYPAK